MSDLDAGIVAVTPTLTRIGASVALDGRLSWAPRIEGHYQPINCYVALDGAGRTLVETGLAAHRQTLFTQLRQTLTADEPFLIFMTRTEHECSGNLSAITAAMNVSKVIFGGGGNPFDAYDEVTRSAKSDVARQALPPAGAAMAPLGDSQSLYLVPARIRILTTYWLYDRTSKTLFTSDVFGHTSHPAGGPVVLSTLDEDETTFESARQHILQKFFWLPEARTHLLKQWLERVFSECDVEIIAPTHGSVLRGRPLVEKHYAILQDVLSAR